MELLQVDLGSPVLRFDCGNHILTFEAVRLYNCIEKKVGMETKFSIEVSCFMNICCNLVWIKSIL